MEPCGSGDLQPLSARAKPHLIWIWRDPVCRREVWRPCAGSPGAALQTAAWTVLLQTAATLIHANCRSRDGSRVPDTGVRAAEMLRWFWGSCSFSVTRGTETRLQNPPGGMAPRSSMDPVASRCPS